MDDFNFGFEEKPLNLTTIQELDSMVKTMFEKRAEVERLEDQASDLNKEVEKLKAKVMSILEATGRLNHDTPGVGKVTAVTKYQVSFPKDEENASKFRQYLLDNGMDSMLTLNHQTLNAFYKSKLEEAGEGADPTSVLPGIGNPEARVTLSMRKGK
jgi:predicted RNase H-like nuclease (RuvC/YqgF family)